MENKTNNHSYYQVSRDLKRFTEDYFTYLINDNSLSETAKERRITEDSQIFLGLARIYRDSQTIEFISGLLEKKLEQTTAEQFRRK